MEAKQFWQTREGLDAWNKTALAGEYNLEITIPMRIGLRPIIWYTKIEGQTTSCSLVSDAQINEGESKEVELFILNELQLQHPIIKGMVLNIGSIDHSSVNKFGEFEVLEHLGEWEKGKLP
jgi:hypothetical protein